MPYYDFNCPSCGVYEASGHRDDRHQVCVCGAIAERLPYSGVPQLKGETVSLNIPDPSYRFDAGAREHRATGWDLDRAVRHLRSARTEDKDGRTFVGLKGVTNE